MGVRMKLGFSYLAMVLMIVVLGVFALWSMSNMQKSADDAAVAALKYMKSSDNMNVAVSDYRAAMYKLLYPQKPRSRKQPPTLKSAKPPKSSTIPSLKCLMASSL